MVTEKSPSCTLLSPSLASLEVFGLLENAEIVIADFDFTLWRFLPGHKQAVKEIEDAYGSKFAGAFDRYFMLNWMAVQTSELKNWEGFSDYHHFLKRVRSLQKDKELDPKYWCRKMWAVLAAQDCGKDFNALDLNYINNLYWECILQHGSFYEDAELFLERVKSLSLPLIVMTGSDSIMNLLPDGLFEYDPIHSTEYKLSRMQPVLKYAAEVIVGDPEDKPSPHYFKRVFDSIRRLNATVPMGKMLFVGDSYTADLKVPNARQCKTILIKRDH